MRKLNYELKQLGYANRDGGYATREKRARTLSLVANQLHALGYRRMQATSLKPKHIAALVGAWRDGNEEVGIKAVSVGTLQNRLSVLRWWATKVNKASVMARSNDEYGIGGRTRTAIENRAVTLATPALLAIRDDHLRLSLELQAAFGLRREEAMKFSPSYADRADHVALKSGWTKGGRPRTVPIRTVEQRELLIRAHKLAGRGSLIPSDRRYVDQLRLYERETARVGLSKLHGLRHAYAQARYRELTRWDAPVAGGPSRAAMTLEQRDIDRDARLVISAELGHEREQVTAVYLGR